MNDRHRIEDIQGPPRRTDPCNSIASAPRAASRRPRTASHTLAVAGLVALLAACGSGDGGVHDATASDTLEPAATAVAADVLTAAASPAPPAQPAPIVETLAPVVPPPSADKTAATINTVDTVVADMRLPNDAVLRGYEDRSGGWYTGPGTNQMGADPRHASIAQWFRSAYPGFASAEPMRALLPWAVIFDGVEHRARNTRVQIRSMRAYVKSRATGRWTSLGVSPGVSGSAVPKRALFGTAEPEIRRVLGDGSVEIRPPADPALAWHGWWNHGRVRIDPADIAAVFVTLQARLVVDDASGPDDREQASLLIQVGADYYPDLDRGWPGPNPAVGTSRAKMVRREWQGFSMTTLVDVGLQDPGSGITEAALRADPPPLD